MFAGTHTVQIDLSSYKRFICVQHVFHFLIHNGNYFSLFCLKAEYLNKKDEKKFD
jgi:hypothetical protein